ncbi:hypothetical protein C8R45DRAFT_940951 [Mycena sanguinolenta]|nr:hypothetical protein C8R45DRAFT_940951 [Mycena sanguinolenta]
MQFKALASIVALSAIVSVNAAPNDICLKICAPEELTCADGWHSQKVGDYCYTCCLDQQGSMKSAKVEPAASVCWSICLPESPQCAGDWIPRQLGDCWTCCSLSIGPNVPKDVSPLYILRTFERVEKRAVKVLKFGMLD